LAILVILVLGVLWAAVLLPPILRSRNESGVSGGVGDFLSSLRDRFGAGHPGGGHLGGGLGGRMGGGMGGVGRSNDSFAPMRPIMGPVTPYGVPQGPVNGMGMPMGPVSVPGAMTPQQRRRRDVFVGLLGLAGFTMLLALMARTPIFFVFQLLADGALGGYVYILLQYKARAQADRPHDERPRAARPSPTGVPAMPNVHDLSARRFPPAMQPSHVEAAPREATVIALRRSASW
jgi:hypothetical protein